LLPFQGFYFLNLILNFFFINSKQFLELIDSGLLIYLFIYLFFVKLPRQTKNVFVYYLVSSKTVEEFVWNKCCAKNWVKNKIKFKKLKINLKKSYHLKQLIKKIHKEFSKKKILKLITLDQEIMKKIIFHYTPPPPLIEIIDDDDEVVINENKEKNENDKNIIKNENEIKNEKNIIKNENDKNTIKNENDNTIKNENDKNIIKNENEIKNEKENNLKNEIKNDDNNNNIIKNENVKNLNENNNLNDKNIKNENIKNNNIDNSDEINEIINFFDESNILNNSCTIVDDNLTTSNNNSTIVNDIDNSGIEIIDLENENEIKKIEIEEKIETKEKIDEKKFDKDSLVTSMISEIKFFDSLYIEDPVSISLAEKLLSLAQYRDAKLIFEMGNLEEK
jgi:hypothetical protein